MGHVTWAQPKSAHLEWVAPISWVLFDALHYLLWCTLNVLRNGQFIMQNCIMDYPIRNVLMVHQSKNKSCVKKLPNLTQHEFLTFIIFSYSTFLYIFFYKNTQQRYTMKTSSIVYIIIMEISFHLISNTHTQKRREGCKERNRIEKKKKVMRGG